MQHTTNYNLNKFEATDHVTRDIFNANADLIDAALKSVSEAAAAASAGVKITYGTYTGNGSTSTDSQTIQLGFTPVFLILWGTQDVYEVLSFCGTSIHAISVRGSVSGATGISIIDKASLTNNGFTVYGPYQHNQNGRTYHYIAFGI